MTDRVTLRPGDYVTTKGMTEDQYHAVARAFMAAGAGAGEYPNTAYAMDKDHLPAFGWPSERDGLYHGQLGPGSDCGERHLTIGQVLNATNAVNEAEKSMTPCEKLGYKVGDVFEYAGSATGIFPLGARIMLIEDDGSRNPKFEGVGCRAYDGDTWAFASLNNVKPLEEDTPEPTLSSGPIATLRQARQSRDEAEQAYQEALEDVRDALGGEFHLTDVGADGPLADGEDMSDPANWREGDVLEVIGVDSGDGVRKGDLVVHADAAGDPVPYCKNPDGKIKALVANRQLRFHHRP